MATPPVTANYRVVLVPDTTAINNMLSGRTGDLRRVMSGFAGVATRNARNLAAARLNKGANLSPNSGAYARSIHTRFPSPDNMELRAEVPYAATLELGSGSHTITGNPMLQWPPERSNTGKWVRRFAVTHPGNRKPQRILTDAVIQTGRQLGF